MKNKRINGLKKMEGSKRNTMETTKTKKYTMIITFTIIWRKKN